MFTVDEYRARYSRSTSEELLSLLAIDPQHLTPAARQALAEETARRGLDPTHPPIEIVESAPQGQRIYPKASVSSRFGAYIVDSIIGMGPVILAAVFGFLFHLGAQSPTTQLVNYLATIAWAIYYGFTKDARPNGQSIGKKMFGLMVVNVDTNSPCSLGASIGRALPPFLLSAIPIVGWLIEPLAVVGSKDGRRLGDRAASTQVIRASVYEA